MRGLMFLIVGARGEFFKDVVDIDDGCACARASREVVLLCVKSERM